MAIKACVTYAISYIKVGTNQLRSKTKQYDGVAEGKKLGFLHCDYSSL
jgi:hypothetical protein